MTEAEELELLELEALAGSQPSPAPEAPPRKQGLTETIRGIGQQTTRGSLSGFGDEVIGGSRAAIDYILPGGGNEPFADTYRSYRDDERESMKAYEKENPKTAFASNVVGSFANPINKIAPGWGATGKWGTAFPRLLQGEVLKALSKERVPVRVVLKIRLPLRLEGQGLALV
jgi:hypothetical protein